jgi:hypothetical protein
VQAFPSLHDVPFAATGLEQAPVVVSQVPATWHASLAVHVTALPPVQVPLWQVSASVHAFPSLHDVPFAATGFEQTPVVVLHVPATWHASLAVHVTAVPAVHVPLWHVSASVHALPSLQDVPFVATGFEQIPVVVLHVPATWHASLAVHVTPAQRFVPPVPTFNAIICMTHEPETDVEALPWWAPATVTLLSSVMSPSDVSDRMVKPVPRSVVGC